MNKWNNKFRYRVASCWLFIPSLKYQFCKEERILHKKGNLILTYFTVRQVLNNNPQRSRLRGRPKNTWRNCVQRDINRCKIKNWKQRSRNTADWEKFVKEEKVRIGL